jgi:hypothetical protein
VLQQVARVLRRTMFSNVCGGGAEQAANGEESPLNERFRNRREYLECYIKPFFNRVDNAVVDYHVKLDARIAPIELGHWDTEMAERKAR